MARHTRATTARAPFLRRVWLDPARVAHDAWQHYPFALPFLARRRAFDFDLANPVTVIVGENGSGKSTLIEAFATLAGFDIAGGAPAHRRTNGETSGLTAALRAAWLPKPGHGFFFRAETFHDLARFLEEAYPDRNDFLANSHGEGFVRFFDQRMGHAGLYLFDEPESALSPARQIEFLRLLKSHVDRGSTQLVIATHAPLLMAFPGAALFEVTPHGIEPTTLTRTSHFRLLREFVSDPDTFIAGMVEG